MLSIYKKEIATYFNSLMGYLVIGFFLLITGLLLWFFPDTSIPDYGYATLESFFQLSPYLFMFLIPAITMRSIAGEKAEGTWELLLTRPIGMWHLIIGKYLGSLTVVLLALLPTLIYAYTIYRLALPEGNIDTGALLGSYLGLVLLGAVFAAIGLFTSALSRNAVISFLIAVLLSFLLFYAFDALSKTPFFSSQAYSVSRLGAQSHYEAISRGVLDSRDALYFISVIAVFLGCTHAVLNRSRNMQKKRTTAGLVLIGGVIVINVIGSFYFSRIDFTAEKRFTLSSLSKHTVSHLQQKVHLTLLLDGQLPSGFERLKRSALDLMNDLASYSAGKITFEVVNPLDGNAQQQQANTEALADRGITPTNLNVRTETGFSQQLIFPAALITYGDQEIPVNLLLSRAGASHETVLNNSIQNLEYAILSALRKIVSGGRPLIGFTEGHGELNNLQLFDAIQALTTGFQVGFVNLDSITFEGLSQLTALVVAKPTQPFSEAEKFKIDHFVMNGGNVLWAIDQTDAELDSMRTTGEQTIIARQLNLDDLLFTYGIRFNYQLLADMNCAQIPLAMGNVGNQAQIELAPWLFHPVFIPTAPHLIVKNLEGIRSEFAGTLDTIAVPGIYKSVILHSSPFSRLLNLPATVSLQLVEETPDPTQFRNKPFAVAALLEGPFPSAFLNRAVPPEINAPIQIPVQGKPAKMIAIADGDVFRGQVNPTDGSPYPLGWDRYTEQQYGNKSFLLNAIDYLTDDADIIALRGKEIKLRLLDQVKISDERLYWQLVNVALPPALLVLFGFVRRYLRRRRYAQPMI
ncbi:gliding motility-associated ABC transporter substrate-binding protein GldG [Parapedobacter sp. GCM10030251]|uniref:gliding motility-associated ABC transporter substrate-binding protein GldG n=1 Tax=Parapedobacter sp. GCM10030251 TaxID=3273419 RepID=UPI0036074BFE